VSKLWLILVACLLSGHAFAGAGASVCDVTPASADTLTAAGTFATTCLIGYYDPGQSLVIHAQGVFTTTATASPVESIQVNAFGTTGICTHSGNNSVAVSLTNDSWDVTCHIKILTAGNPGTATTWGTDEVVIANSSGTFASHNYPQNAASQAAITTTPQTVSIQEIGPLVSGESFTLQSLTVDAKGIN
jgi:hypothetical protein